MGNQICGGETVRANAKAEADEELTMEKSKATKSKTTPISEEESARMIQTNYEKEFDENIVNHGKFITEEEMKAKIVEEVKKVEETFGVYNPIEKKEKMLPTVEVFTRGPILFNDDTIYKGSWNYNGKKEGWGVYIKADGSKYEGFWSNDKIEGSGRFIDKSGNHYEGQWKNGMANGHGVLCISQGSCYKGEWVDDFQEGIGEETFPDQTSYKGDFKAGQKHGKGKFTWNDGSYYEGDFVNSVIEGKGRLHWKDGREHFGDWANNKMNGHGTFTWPDGKKYIGEYRNDKKEGKGIYYWNDEKYYDGEWLNSKQHGEGMFVLKGWPLKGKFRFGKIIKRYEAEEPSAEILDKEFKQQTKLSNENINQNLHVDDKEHHIDKIDVGDTNTPNMG